MGRIRCSMGRVVDIQLVGCRYTMGSGVNMPWEKGSIYQG